MFKQKNHRFCFFLGSVGHFFVFCFWFKKKNVGSGLILGSVGLRQYNNFFLALLSSKVIDLNGSQLAKMKKSIPDMSLPWNL